MSRLNLVFLFAFIGLLLWISFFQAEKIDRIQKGTLSLFSPFIKASGRISDSAATLEGEKLSYSEMQESLSAAKRERDSLRLEVLQLDEILYENNELRDALQYTNRSPLNLLPSRVLNRKPLNWYNTMIIDKGAEDGVRPDLAVVVPNGDEAALVGKISEVVGNHSSVVLLLTDEMCQVPALIRGTVEEGILNGERSPIRNQPFLKLRYLSKEAVLHPGDTIVSSGIGEVFRRNLVLGRVQESKKGVIDTEATVVPTVDFEKLVDVFVIMKPTPTPEFSTETTDSKAGGEIKISARP